MAHSEFWKNFSLGTELHISGTFLYNALYSFDRMNSFYFEEECFEFLYQSSVGFERLLKIIIVLSEHTENIDQHSFEKSLITHNHLELYNRIKHKVNFSDVQIQFLKMLSEYYNSKRYDRFGLQSVNNHNSSKELLIGFFEKHLKVEIHAELPISTEIDDRMKKFIGRTIGKMSQILYRLVTEIANQLLIYTYEITYDSKAYKIFICKDYTFENERTLRRELLIAFLHGKFDEGFLEFIKKIKPIKFDSYSAYEYIKYLVEIHPKQYLLEELESLYKDGKFDKKRATDVSILGIDVCLEEDDNDNP